MGIGRLAAFFLSLSQIFYVYDKNAESNQTDESSVDTIHACYLLWVDGNRSGADTGATPR